MRPGAAIAVLVGANLARVGGRLTPSPFESDRDGNVAIYLMNADGSEQRALTDNRA